MNPSVVSVDGINMIASIKLLNACLSFHSYAVIAYAVRAEKNTFRRVLEVAIMNEFLKVIHK